MSGPTLLTVVLNYRTPEMTLKAVEAVPRLVWTLEDPDGDVSRAALEALRVLTGQNLPLDPASWQVATSTAPRDAGL